MRRSSFATYLTQTMGLTEPGVYYRLFAKVTIEQAAEVTVGHAEAGDTVISVALQLYYSSPFFSKFKLATLML